MAARRCGTCRRRCRRRWRSSRRSSRGRSTSRKKQHALFLGRGLHYPIALEGALKLKEISYIHAEAYPAGELKHGPLALVDADMPVVAIAPNDALLEKLKSNLQEVRARGGELYVVADLDSHLSAERRHPRDPAARARGALSPDRAHDPAAAARVSRRGAARHRRGQAAESGEERDGGVNGRRGLQPGEPDTLAG